MNAARAKAIAFRVALGFSLASLAAYAFVAVRVDYAVAREIWQLRVSGYSAVAFLVVALSATPARKVVAWAGRPMPTVLVNAHRRAFGICAALFSMLHAGTAMTTYLEGAWSAVLERPHLRLGLLGLVVLVSLFATSFGRPIAWMRLKVWKQLHRLSYLAAVFVFLHLMQSSFAPRRWVLGVFTALVLVGLLRLLPERRSRAPRASQAVGR